MTFGLQHGVWEESSRKLTRPTACTAAAAQTFSLPLNNGEGRFLAKAPTTCRTIRRYSSLRCFAQKVSVRVVTAENLSAMALGIFSGKDMMTVEVLNNIFTDQLTE